MRPSGGGRHRSPVHWAFIGGCWGLKSCVITCQMKTHGLRKKRLYSRGPCGDGTLQGRVTMRSAGTWWSDTSFPSQGGVDGTRGAVGPRVQQRVVIEDVPGAGLFSGP